jgi:DNA-binding SARP family transcriptional activator
VRPKQRVVLALLLLHTNEVVATDELVDALWGEAPPETAPTALRGHVSALRKLLGSDTIETRPPGYVLRLRPEQLDLARFQELADEARAEVDPARKAELLRSAWGFSAASRSPTSLRRICRQRGGAQPGAAPRSARGALRGGADRFALRTIPELESLSRQTHSENASGGS